MNPVVYKIIRAKAQSYNKIQAAPTMFKVLARTTGSTRWIYSNIAISILNSGESVN